ncbi:conserved hypothetical protein [Vibrio phage 22O28-1]|nr:conserved hypothetical protein [Vibrio phage 22O28-1]
MKDKNFYKALATEGVSPLFLEAFAGEVKKSHEINKLASMQPRKGLDIAALIEARKILDAANVPPIEREVQDRVLTLASQAWEEIDEMVLACLAAGVPSSRILVREPFPVVKGSVWQVEAGISFCEDCK